MSTGGDPHAAAGKLAQLLGEVIVHHAPWTAQISEEEKWRQTKQFMDELEVHTSGQVGPFLQKILDIADVPDVFKPLLEEAIEPPAAFSAILEQVFLYGIVSNLIGTATTPFLQGVVNSLWQVASDTGINVPVSPAILATAAGRGLVLGDAPTVSVPDSYYSEAAKSGVSKADLDLQASLVGLPPAFQELLEMERRGIITTAQLEKGLQEGDFRDDWIQYAVQLKYGWLTPLDFVRAAVQAQMTYEDAAQWAQKTGLDTTTALPLDTGNTEASPDMFGLAFSIAGRPPGPEELARAANRGIIDWTGTGADATTFQQGIAESDVKTKWTPILQALAEYVPPPRSVGTLLERGVVTAAQAQQLWEDGGVPETLAKAYVAMAEQQSTIQDKLLAKGEIVTGYYDQLFSKQQAEELLGLLGYTGQVAADILATVDFRREIQAINGVVRRISNLYANYKLTNANALSALEEVGLESSQANAILTSWDALRKQPIRVPTTAEIGLATKYGTLTQEQALTELEALGYQPRDAAIVLSAHSEEPVQPLPASGSTITG